MIIYFVFGFMFSYFSIHLAYLKEIIEEKDEQYILFGFLIIAAFWPIAMTYAIYKLIWGKE